MKKKLIALLLSLLLILCTASVALAANKPGDTVTVTVSVSGAGEQFGIYVDYPAELVFVSAKPSVGFAGAHRWGHAQLGSIGSASCIYTFRIADDAKDGTYEVKPTFETGSGTLTGGSVTVGEEAHKHNYKAVVTAPTCTEKGFTTYTCECGDSYVDNYVDPLGHDYQSVVTEPTCTEGGYTTFTCFRCGDSYVDDKTDPLGHDYQSVVTAPTCTEKGFTTYTCSRCNDSYVGDEVDALGHDIVEDAAVAPTCTETGLTAGEHCSRCDYKVAQEEIPALGHDITDMPAVEPTCTEPGLTAGGKCSRCDYEVKQEEVPALGHDIVEDAAVAPTCTETGLTAGEHCSRCDYKVAQEEIPALGHTWGEWEETLAPTYDAEGEETRVCSVCGEKETRPVPKKELEDAKYILEIVSCTKTGTVAKVTHVEGTKTLNGLRMKVYMLGEGNSYVCVIFPIIPDGATIEIPYEGAFGVSISLYDVDTGKDITDPYGKVFE